MPWRMWGYPLWLFLGLWIVLNARLLERVTLVAHRRSLWGVVFISYGRWPLRRLRLLAALSGRTTAR